MGFEIKFIIALFFILYVRIKDPHAIRVQLDYVAKFLAFMAIVTCGRIAGYDFLTLGGAPLPGVPSKLLEVGMWPLFLVFWEDAFYVLPMYLVSKWERGILIPGLSLTKAKKTLINRLSIPWPKINKKSFLFKPITLAIIVGLSIDFALGHSYQGLSGILITMFYPFFVSLRYGKRIGFGTVMVCHILYDFITIITIKLMPLFLN